MNITASWYTDVPLLQYKNKSQINHGYLLEISEVWQRSISTLVEEMKKQYMTSAIAFFVKR